jgi:outer membrane protein assembly factor BamB
MVERGDGKMKTLVALGLFFSMIVSISSAAEISPWPQFRGPGGSGVANGQQPPTEFGPQKNLKWKVAVPGGVSSPIVAGDNIILTAFDDGKLYTIAYRRADGKEGWRAEAPAKQIEPFHKTESSPAASTPATDGERIIAYFGSCGLWCYDLSGKELWKYEMPAAATGGDFGSGVSPIVAEGVVILVRDELKNARIIALDASTGSLLWETKRQSPMSFSSPVVWDVPGGKQVAAAGHACLTGYDLKTGAQKWLVPGIPARCCPSPVTDGGRLFFAGGFASGPDDKDQQVPTYDSLLKDLDKDKDGTLSREEGEKNFQGFFDNLDHNKDGKVSRDEWDAVRKTLSEGKSAAFALRSGGSGDLTETHMLWKKTKGLPTVASAIVYGGQYVMVKDGGVITAYDVRSGDEVYQKRAAAVGAYYASPVAAGGHIYFTSLTDGEVTVLKAGVADAEVVARNAPLGERVAATPAIADNTLYIRAAEHLYAFATPE